MTGPSTIRQDGPDVLLAVRVRPRASRNQAIVQPDHIALRLTAPPVEGAANAAVCGFLAELCGVAKSRILIVRGDTARVKLVRIRNANADDVLAHLQTCREASSSR